MNEHLRRDVIEQIRSLIQIESTQERPEDRLRALESIIHFATNGLKDITVERFTSNGVESALLYIGKKRPYFSVLLNAHLDVVPGGHSQFSPHEENGNLIGRGALDMKSAAVVMATAFRELAPILSQPIGLQLVTDEEFGGRDGTGYQLEQGVRSNFAICGEYTLPATICTDSKGICRARIQFNGKTAHGAYTWAGDNAIVQGVQYVDALLATNPIPEKEQWTTTINVAAFETPGAVINKVPDTAVIELDIRYIPTDAIFSNKEAAEVFLQQLNPRATIAIMRHETAHHISPDDPYLKELASIVEESWHKEVALVRKPGAADTRFFHGHGTPSVVLGVQGANPHADNEYVELSSLNRYYNIVARFLRSIDKT